MPPNSTACSARWPRAPHRANGWALHSNHDHRHLSEGRDRNGKTRQGQGHHQRHGQGLRHDHADMATMLAFVFTDAPITASALQSLLKSGVEDTFNAVTVDGDTSTSDTLLAFATGAAAANGAPKISRASDPRLKAFTKAFAPYSPIWPNRSRGTAKARESWSRLSSRVRPRKPRRAASRCRWRTRRW